MPDQAYNYDTFHRSTMKEDMHFRGGPQPGQPAVAFDLPTTTGTRFRLTEYQGKSPVLLEFGSISCPMTAGANPTMKKLFTDYGDRVKFVTVYVREAHPGENYPHHTSEQQKVRHASDWKRLDDIPWEVAVDELDGTVHNAYGPLPNSVYLIDSTGQVAFRALFAGQEGLLRDKLATLLEHEDSGEVPVNLGQQENLMIPLVKSMRHFDHAVARAGKKAEQDFHREMGGMMYAFEKIMSKTR